MRAVVVSLAVLALIGCGNASQAGTAARSAELTQEIATLSAPAPTLAAATTPVLTLTPAATATPASPTSDRWSAAGTVIPVLALLLFLIVAANVAYRRTHPRARWFEDVDDDGEGSHVW